MLRSSARRIASVKTPAMGLASKLRAATPKSVFSTAPVIEKAPTNGTIVSPSGITRPISPDLAIWRFSPTAYLHVGVRISGAMLSVGLMGAGIDAAISPEPHVYDLLQAIQGYPVILPIAKAAVVAPLTYHFLGGARQIYHDMTAKGIDTEFQDKTSIAMAAVTGVATVAAMMV